jgi:endonuclease VIII
MACRLVSGSEMPEGDTLFRTARTLNRALAGRAVTAFETVLPALARVDHDHPIAARTVVGVRSVGKHLLIEFTGGLFLRTHMRMNGDWHIYRPGERWRRPRSAMRVVIATDEFVAVAFGVPVAEFVAARDLERHVELGALGPDLLDERFDAGEAARRLRARPHADLAEVLLNQRVMAGVGNVFKSEVLFVAGLDPFRAVGSLADEQVTRLVAVARDLLRANVFDAARAGAATWGGYRRTTRSAHPDARLWVYGRSGRPCRRCGTPIAYRKQGANARGTYWCARCQT